MNCPDVNAALLGEATAAERRAFEEHLPACPACQEEWARMESTLAVLRAAPEEEMPRRISFVSDKVFEPRWWQRLLGNGPALGFASAAMLSAAILTHAVYPRPVAPAEMAAAPVVQAAPVNLEATVRDAVKQAIAETDARHKKETAALLEAAEKRYDERLRETQAMVDASFEILARKVANVKRAAYARSDMGER
ncbi:MAG: zf-HC2 domain-containing protein [Bryobacteraceae bacterium]